MATTVKKFNLEGQEVGSIEVPEEFLETRVNVQMIKDYLIALRTNKRQWSANTKTRREISHSNQKPHPQKGTGRARQGFLGSPQYRGGGRVGAPRPKFDKHVRINKKERRGAIRHLMAEKIREGRLFVLETPQMKEPKTKRIVNFLKKGGLSGKRTLFLAGGVVKGTKERGQPHLPRIEVEQFAKSIRNVPKTSFLFLPNMSGYDAAVHEDVVVMDDAVDELLVLLKE